MPANRPRAVMLYLTDEQHALARRRMALDRITWQSFGMAAVNAYILGNLQVSPQGEFAVDPAGDTERLVFREDAEAVRRQVEESAAKAPPRALKDHGPRQLTTSALARAIENDTGRRVSVDMLRELLKRSFREAKTNPDSLKSRWRVEEGSELQDRITRAVAEGALDEIRDARFKTFGGPKL